MPSAAPLTATATPTSGGADVAGTTEAGANVVIAATLSPAGATNPGGSAHSQSVPTQTAQLSAGEDGSFATTLALTPGTWVVTVTATAGSETAHQQLSVTVS